MFDAGVCFTDDSIGVTLLYTFVFVKTYFVFGDFVKNIVSFDPQVVHVVKALSALTESKFSRL